MNDNALRFFLCPAAPAALRALPNLPHSSFVFLREVEKKAGRQDRERLRV
jgi:hypothetical protein